MPEYSFTMDGNPVCVDTAGDPNVLYVMRDLLGNTGPKYGCGIAVCQACTCLVDGAPVQTCQVPVSTVVGREVTTIRGISPTGELHPLQQAWIDLDVAQCGFCQPGQIMAAGAKISQKGAALDDDDIDEIENVCRCAMYYRIRQAIKAVGADGAFTTAPFRRFGGAERMETAALISQNIWCAGAARSAVIVRADNFPDALTGASLAAVTDGPVLLARTDRLDATTTAELTRAVAPGSTVHLAGGTAALAESVETEVAGLGFDVVRVGGADRQETAALLAARTTGEPAAIFIVSGDEFGEAMVAGATAARIGGVALLTNVNGLSPAGEEYLAAHPGVPVHVVGEQAASTEGDRGSVIRGADMFETSVRLARTFRDGLNGVALVGTDTFADGLAGGAHAARQGLAVLLTPSSSLPDSVAGYLASSSLGQMVVYGGPAAISFDVATAASEALRS